MGDQGRITLDQDVMTEEATDILPPLDRSWRIMRFGLQIHTYIRPCIHICIQTYIHVYRRAYMHA